MKFDRGFTGHEHLDMFNLINMNIFDKSMNRSEVYFASVIARKYLSLLNARLYDPILGQFPSADPYVQAPEFSQAYNRYSYALNNPMAYVDPSGRSFWKKFFKGLMIWDVFSGGAFTLMATSSYLAGSETLYKMQKLTSPIAVKLNFHMGSDVNGIGFDISVGMPTITPSYRAHAGMSLYYNYYGDATNVFEFRSGAELSPTPFLSYSGTRYRSPSGNLDQTTNLVTFGGPFINASYENDWMLSQKMPGVPKGDGDRFRTAAVQFNIMEIGVGLNMMTGDRGKDLDGNPNWETTGKYRTYINNNTGGDPDKYRLGALYVKAGPFRLGWNSEGIRNAIQNKWIHGTKFPHFKKLKRNRLYWYIGSGTVNSLW